MIVKWGSLTGHAYLESSAGLPHRILAYCQDDLVRRQTTRKCFHYRAITWDFIS